MLPEPQLVTTREAADNSGGKPAAARASPLRVLRVIAGVHVDAGGPPESFQASCLAIADAGVSVSAAFPVDSTRRGEAETVSARLAAGGIEVHAFEFSRLFPRRSRALGVSWPLGLWLLRNVRRYDVVHVHGAWTFPSLAALVGARLGRRPVALTPHESLTQFDLAKKSWLPRTVKRVLRIAYVRSVDLLVFSSHLEQQASLNGGRRRAAATVPHPVCMQPRTQRIRGGEARQMLRVGFLGRFDEKKNLDRLIEAASRCPFVELRIAGAGPQEPRLRSLSARLGIEDRAVWLGFVTGPEREAFFASIDLLVMPSAFECFGMAAAEAIARGVPVLSSPTTGISEVVERYGCGAIVQPEAGAIADRLRSVHELPATLEEFAARTHLAVVDLSPARHGERLRQEYQRLLRERR